MMSVTAFADGRSSCRIYGDGDNMAALESNFVCETPHMSSGTPGIDIKVNLEKPAKPNTVVFVEVTINGHTYNVRVEFSEGSKIARVVHYTGVKDGDCASLSLASGSCRL